MTLSMNLDQLQTLMLTSVRIIAFLVVAPPFAHRSFPGSVKAMLGVGIALAMLPKLTAAGTPADLGTGQYIAALAIQAFAGAALGFVVYVVFAAVESAGGLIDIMGGFSMGQSFDPMSNTNSSSFSKLFQLTALTIIFASNAHQVILGGLFKSFEFVPPGQGIDLANLGEVLTQGVTTMFLSAIQIAGPLVIILILSDMGLGLLSRVAPALNVFVLSFPLKIYLTLSLVSIVYLTMPQVIELLSSSAISRLWEVIR